MRRSWAGLLGTGHLVLLLALLPSVLYIDHWSEFLWPERPQSLSAGEEEAHESHCHYASGTCAQPVPTNLKVLAAVVDVPLPQLVSTALEDVTAGFQETFITPPTEPPRA